ncbi:asparaginase [Aquimarina sp. U1-2]|uniref:asparaginase domain-containing protein n=1 Tax=Aquimarina sp. U1-2 TaxID=2823141 RepID=UPI001AECC7B9|nr:asparaginase domain-containing protein [Aquimarina sp. U1-2]MBP2831815.1 asparaginase [Aquimarina sp. U1-2]
MINIITTGGTIEGYDNSRNQNIGRTKISISDFLIAANVNFEYTMKSLFKKDSREITENDRLKISEQILVSKSDKILVTHGTYTMIDTAAYLGNQNLKKTIVLVGSFIFGNEKESDAPFNLGYAIGALQFLSPAVYIAMNGEIFQWNKVHKNLAINKFQSHAN